MTRARGELPEPEEQLLGIYRPTIEEEEQAEAEKAEADEMRRVWLVNQMHNPMFREWLMGWLEHFGTFANTFAVSPTGFPDPLATQFKLGMKAAGWEIWESIDALAPDLASKMRRRDER